MANPAHYGNHIAEVVHWDIPDTDKEHPQVVVELKIVSEGKAHGAKKFWYGSLKPGQAFDITLRGLREMGFKGNDFSSLIQDPNAQFENTALERGKQVEIQVYGHEYQGKTYERINVGSRPSAASMPVVKAKAKLAHLKGLADAYDAKAGTKHEEDVPF